MRRRLIRLVAIGIVLPAAARGAALAPDRLEAAKGSSVASRSLRRAANLAGRSRRRR